MWGKWRLSTSLVGCPWCSTKGNSLGNGPRKVKQNCHKPSNSTPRYLLQRNGNICPRENLYLKVHGSIIQTAKMWKHPHGHQFYITECCSLLTKRNAWLICATAQVSLGNYAEWKEPCKGHTLHDSVYARCSQGAEPQKQEVRWWVSRAEGWGVGESWRELCTVFYVEWWKYAKINYDVCRILWIY